MSEMVERVAKAILAADPKSQRDVVTEFPELLAKWEMDRARRFARAAIAAMREPTQEMRHRIWDCLEGNARVGNCMPGQIRGNGMPDAFLGMVVAEALKD